MLNNPLNAAFTNKFFLLARITNSGRIIDMNGTWKYEYNHPYINIHYKMSDGSEILMEYELVNDRTMERINAAIGETYIRQN